VNAKEYLSQAMYIDQRINSKLEQVTRLRENVTNCTATLSDMPRPDSPNKQRMEETICKIVDLEREINADIDRLVDLKAEARKAINAVSDPVQQLILELRYLCYKPWLEIAETIGYSEATVYRLHGEALKNIAVPEKFTFNGEK
jgi:DNA-directed RNA polymerase specialized sigma subunit